MIHAPGMVKAMERAGRQAQQEAKLLAVLALSTPAARKAAMAEVERRTVLFSEQHRASAWQSPESPIEAACDSVIHDLTFGRLG